jgi:hypothetical protein
MKKILALLVLLTAVIFLTGCTEQQSSGTTFIGGTEGLRVSFVEGSPPSVTTDNGMSPFSIILKVQNIGESTVAANDAYVQISGIDGGVYGSKYPDFKRTFSEEVRSAAKNGNTVLNGGISTVEFAELSYKGVSVGEQQQDIWADICYKYSTKAIAQICVKNNAEQALTGKDICQVEGEKNPQNSGAPVQVTSIKETYAGNGKIGLTLTISHTGAGDNIFKAASGAPVCNNVLSNTDAGKVKVAFKQVQVGGTKADVQCQGMDSEGYVRLYTEGTNKATYNLYCTVDVSGSKNVVAVPLEVELNYAYLQHLTKTMTLRHVTK